MFAACPTPGFDAATPPPPPPPLPPPPLPPPLPRPLPCLACACQTPATDALMTKENCCTVTPGFLRDFFCSCLFESGCWIRVGVPRGRHAHACGGARSSPPLRPSPTTPTSPATTATVARLYTPASLPLTHARTHTRTHTRTHSLTHSHTHSLGHLFCLHRTVVIAVQGQMIKSSVVVMYFYVCGCTSITSVVCVF